MIFVCEDFKQLLYRLYEAIFQFYVEKCPEDGEDADVSELCGCAPPHPVRCPAVIINYSYFVQQSKFLKTCLLINLWSQTSKLAHLLFLGLAMEVIIGKQLISQIYPLIMKWLGAERCVEIIENLRFFPGSA